MPKSFASQRDSDAVKELPISAISKHAKKRSRPSEVVDDDYNLADNTKRAAHCGSASEFLALSELCQRSYVWSVSKHHLTGISFVATFVAFAIIT
jgi:hypothetical protein